MIVGLLTTLGVDTAVFPWTVALVRLVVGVTVTNVVELVVVVGVVGVGLATVGEET